MRERKFLSIGELLGSQLQRLGAEEVVVENKLKSNWSKVVGPALAKNCAPDCIEDHTLYIRVENEIWRRELAIKRTELLNLVVRNLKSEYKIDRIKFK
jgi:predicted nucleic acid-binding Zn ribbon protein